MRLEALLKGEKQRGDDLAAETEALTRELHQSSEARDRAETAIEELKERVRNLTREQQSLSLSAEIAP